MILDFPYTVSDEEALERLHALTDYWLAKHSVRARWEGPEVFFNGKVKGVKFDGTVVVGGKKVHADVNVGFLAEKIGGKAYVQRKLADYLGPANTLAELKARATAAKVFVNHCIAQHLEGKLDVPTACMAKLWLTELQGEVVDKCLQLHGGSGYINDYPIARMFRDSRVSRIFGGSNEIMKMVIARSMDSGRGRRTTGFTISPAARLPALPPIATVCRRELVRIRARICASGSSTPEPSPRARRCQAACSTGTAIAGSSRASFRPRRQSTPVITRNSSRAT